MQFRLIYEGPLPSATPNKPRTDAKHDIRRQLHPQLRELLQTHPLVKHNLQPRLVADHRPYVELVADMYARCGFRFVPLIGNDVVFISRPLAVALDILFLRRDAPGNVIQHGGGGDLDNRIKVLFDALRIPENCSQLPRDATPTADETPFYCLLENDSLIANVAITTDRLLSPLGGGGHIHDVKLIVHVTTLIVGTDI